MIIVPSYHRENTSNIDPFYHKSFSSWANQIFNFIYLNNIYQQTHKQTVSAQSLSNIPSKSIFQFGLEKLNLEVFNLLLFHFHHGAKPSPLRHSSNIGNSNSLSPPWGSNTRCLLVLLVYIYLLIKHKKIPKFVYLHKWWWLWFVLSCLYFDLMAYNCHGTLVV